MKKFIAIVAGEPVSINSEIIVKAWKKNKKKNLFVIGSFLLLKKQLQKLNLRIPLVKIHEIKDLKVNSKLHVLDVKINFKLPFKIYKKKKEYVLRCLNIAHDLSITKKIKGFVNAPIDKTIFNSKYLGVTEYLASKNKVRNKEVMMIYNKKLSVVPITTHIEVSKITKNIKSNIIERKINVLNKFYINFLKKKPRIAILGLNPHNSENKRNSIENKIIKPTMLKIKKKGINISGPFPADTIFSKDKRRKYDVIVGMYHDQVLSPFKALYGFDAINITLGLKYIRTSPDHGTAADIIGKNKGDPESLISSINFITKTNND